MEIDSKYTGEIQVEAAPLISTKESKEEPSPYKGHFVVGVFLPTFVVLAYSERFGLELLGVTFQVETANLWVERQKMEWNCGMSYREEKQGGGITIHHYIGGYKVIVAESNPTELDLFEPLNHERLLLDATKL